MKQISTFLTLALIAAGTLGCSMCCSPYDYDYPTYGGKHERINRTYGRVGSIFSDENAGYYGESADSNLEPAPLPKDRTEENNPPRKTDEEIEKFKRDLESIKPKQGDLRDNIDELPEPDNSTDPTAYRRARGAHSTAFRRRPRNRRLPRRFPR